MTKVTGHKGSTDHLLVPKIEIHKTHTVIGKIRHNSMQNTTTKNIQKNTQSYTQTKINIKIYSIFLSQC